MLKIKNGGIENQNKTFSNLFSNLFLTYSKYKIFSNEEIPKF